MKTEGKGGFLYLALIGFALAILGGAFVAILGRGYIRAKETREWPVQSGMIIRSEVGDRELSPDVPKEYTHDLLFEYRVDGELYQGDRVKRRENPYFKEKAKVEPWLADWPVGTQVDVFVNPEDANEAVLAHETKAPGYTIWFPGLFLVGGLVVFCRAVRGIVSSPIKSGKLDGSSRSSAAG